MYVYMRYSSSHLLNESPPLCTGLPQASSEWDWGEGSGLCSNSRRYNVVNDLV